VATLEHTLDPSPENLDSGPSAIAIPPTKAPLPPEDSSPSSDESFSSDSVSRTCQDYATAEDGPVFGDPDELNHPGGTSSKEVDKMLAKKA